MPSRGRWLPSEVGYLSTCAACVCVQQAHLPTLHPPTEHSLPCAEEGERTFQRLARQQRYLSEWFACSTSLATLPSSVLFADNTEDGDDEASSVPSPKQGRAPAPVGVARGLMSPQDMTISSVASLISVGKPALSEADPEDDDTVIQRPCTHSSSKDPTTQRKKTPAGEARSFLSPHISLCTSDVSQSEDEDHLPAVKSDRMSETLQSIRKNYSQKSRGLLLPSIQSPPLISVSRCSTQSQSQLKDKLQPQRRGSPSLVDSTQSLTAFSDVSLTTQSKKAWNVKTTKSAPKVPSSKVTMSDATRKKVVPAKHRLPAHQSSITITAKEVLQMASGPKTSEEKCPPSVTAVPETDGPLRRKKKATLRRQPLALGTARTGFAGECYSGKSMSYSVCVCV